MIQFLALLNLSCFQSCGIFSFIVILVKETFQKLSTYKVLYTVAIGGVDHAHFHEQVKNEQLTEVCAFTRLITSTKKAHRKKEE